MYREGTPRVRLVQSKKEYNLNRICPIVLFFVFSSGFYARLFEIPLFCGPDFFTSPSFCGLDFFYIPFFPAFWIIPIICPEMTTVQSEYAIFRTGI